MAGAMRGVRAERRAGRRQAAADCRWLTSARLRTGLDVVVIDLGPGGALVEAAARLLPGSTVELHLAAPGWRWSVPARVLRCQVSAVIANEGLRYRAALGFDRCLRPPSPDENGTMASLPSPGTALREQVPGSAAGSNYPFVPPSVTLREVATRAASPCHPAGLERRYRNR